MNHPGPAGISDEEDGFYYDVLRFPDGSATRLKVRSMVGFLPLCATTIEQSRASSREAGGLLHLVAIQRQSDQAVEQVGKANAAVFPHLGVHADRCKARDGIDLVD